MLLLSVGSFSLFRIFIPIFLRLSSFSALKKFCSLETKIEKPLKKAFPRLNLSISSPHRSHCLVRQKTKRNTTPYIIFLKRAQLLADCFLRNYRTRIKLLPYSIHSYAKKNCVFRIFYHFFSFLGSYPPTRGNVYWKIRRRISS